MTTEPKRGDRADQDVQRGVADAVGQAAPRGERVRSQLGARRVHAARSFTVPRRATKAPFTTSTPHVHIP